MSPYGIIEDILLHVSNGDQSVVMDHHKGALFALTAKEETYLNEETNGKLTPVENEFLRAVIDQDSEKVENLLQATKVDVNCEGRRDMQVVSALQIAAENNDFYMVKQLLDHGAKRLVALDPPNDHCEDLSTCLRRLSVYRAISSPAYMSLSSDDPMHEAFVLADELHKLSKSNGIYDICKGQYRQLENQVARFAHALLDNCMTTNEVVTLLHGSHHTAKTRGTKCWATALLAIETEQKEFIANSKCQQVLRSEWLRGQPKWSQRNGILWSLLYILYCLVVYFALQPFLFMVYVAAPCSPISVIVTSPKARFVMYLVSYTMFVILFAFTGVIHLLVKGGAINYLYLFCALLVWLFGMLWREVQQRIYHGVLKYSADLWNILDVFITTSLLALLLAQLYSEMRGLDTQNETWTTLFQLAAFVLVLSFLRFMQNFYLSTTVGNMLLTFISMKTDVTRFLFLFGFVVCSFTIGFFYLYSDAQSPHKFNSLGSSVVQLIFSIFGKDSTSSMSATVMVKLASDDVENTQYNASNVDNGNFSALLTDNAMHYITRDVDNATHYITRDFGYIYSAMGLTLYALFCFLVMLVLLNLCIAMMSDTYTRIKENIDVEWKYVRSSIWLDYFIGPVFPPPLNLLPTPHAIKEAVTSFYRCLCFKECKTSKSKDLEMRGSYDAANTLDYEELMRILLTRYIRKIGKEESKEFGVIRNGVSNEDDPIHATQVTTSIM
ncbi:short transient receptor potential channel 4-like [Saccoglossus kowalevskii]